MAKAFPLNPSIRQEGSSFFYQSGYIKSQNGKDIKN